MGKISYQQLIQALGQGLHGFNTQIPPGRDQSAYLRKNITGKVREVLQKISQNSNGDYRRYFESFFPGQFQAGVSDFKRLLSQQNLMLSQYDEQEVVGYFKIETVSFISKIMFVQGMTQFQSQPNASFSYQNQQNFGGAMAINKETEDLIMGMARKIVNQGFQFEDIMRQSGCQNSQVIGKYDIVKIGENIQVPLFANQVDIILRELDPASMSSVTTTTLRDKVMEAVQKLGGNQMGNQPHNQGASSFPQNNMYNQPGQQAPPLPSGGLGLTKQNATHQHNNPNMNLNLGGVQNQPGPSMLTPNIEKLLAKLKTNISEKRVSQIRNLFPPGNFIQGKQVCREGDFLAALSNPQLKLDYQDVQQIASRYTIRDQSYHTYIDLDSLDRDMYFDDAAGYQLRHDQQQKMHQIFEAIQREIMLRGGDLYQLFKDADVTGDGKISKFELKAQIKEMGFANIDDGTVAGVFQQLDANNDGSITVDELSQFVRNKSQIQAVTDPGHFAYFVFENLRRQMQINGKTVQQLFDVPLNRDQFTGKVMISQNDFFMKIRGMNIPNLMHIEQQLISLLQPDQRGQVDLIRVTELIGVNTSHKQFLNPQQDFMRNDNQWNIQSAVDFYRKLVDVMDQTGMTVQVLQKNFETIDEHLKSDNISQQDFMQSIRMIDRNRQINDEAILQQARKFERRPGQVAYREFMGRLNYENALMETVDFIFITFKNAMDFRRLTNISALFSNMMEIDQNTFYNQIRDTMVIYLTEEEKQALNMSYQSGQGRIDLAKLDRDYQEFQRSHRYQGALMRKNTVQGANKLNRLNTDHSVDMPSSNFGPSNPMPLNQGQVHDLYRKIAQSIESNQNANIEMTVRSIDQMQTDYFTRDQLAQFLQQIAFLSQEESNHVMMNLDSRNTGYVKIADVLTQINNNVHNMHRKTDLAKVVQDCNMRNKNPPNSQLNTGSLQAYQREVQELNQALRQRSYSSFAELFRQNTPMHAMSISIQEFERALMALNCLSVNQNVIRSIYQIMDSSGRGQVDIEQASQQLTGGQSDLSSAQEEQIVEAIVNSVQGNYQHFEQELRRYDRQMTNLLPHDVFLEAMRKISPYLNQRDIQSLGRSYEFNNQVDIQKLLTAFLNKQRSGGNRYTQADPSGPRGNPMAMSQKLINIPSKSYSGDTRTNTTSDQKRLQPPQGFQSQVQPQFLEEIMKATYARGVLVETHFEKFSTGTGNMPKNLQQQQFQRALADIEINWDGQTLARVFNQIDQQFNSKIGFGSKHSNGSITAEEVDKAVAFGLRQGVQELHQQMLSHLKDFLDSRKLSLDPLFQQVDPQKTANAHVEDFRDLMLQQLRCPQIQTPNDCYFLARNYIAGKNTLRYQDLINDIFRAQPVSNMPHANNSNFNPQKDPRLEEICDYILKAVFLQGAQDVQAHIGKFARSPGRIGLDEFMQALDALRLIPECLNRQDADTIFNMADKNQSHICETRYLSDTIQQTSGKAANQLSVDILQKINFDLTSQRKKFSDLFRQFDSSNRGQVLSQEFEQILQREFRLKSIDYQFLSNKYKNAQTNQVNYKLVEQDITHQAPVSSNPLQRGKTVHFVKTSDVLNDIACQLRENRMNSHMLQQDVGKMADPRTGEVQEQQLGLALSRAKIEITNEELEALVLEFKGQQLRSLDTRKFFQELGKVEPTALSAADQQYYSQIRQRLNASVQHKEALIKTLMKSDHTGTGFLSDIVIKDCFAQVKLQDYKPDQAMKPVTRNKQGEFNYKQMLVNMFGYHDMKTYFKKGPKQTQDLQTEPFRGKPELDSICRKILATKKSFQQQVDKMVAGNNPVTERDAIKAIEGFQIVLQVKEKQQLQTYFMAKQGKVAKGMLLNDLGIKQTAQNQQQQPMQAGPTVRMLAQNEKMACHDFMKKLGQYAIQYKVPIEQNFAPEKQRTNSTSISKQSFQKVVKQKFGNVGQTLTDELLELLVSYLQNDHEIGQIDLHRIKSAVDSREPLAQAAMRELKQGQDRIDSQANMPLDIIALLHALRASQVTLVKLYPFFNIQSHQDEIPVQQFWSALENTSFVCENKPALIRSLDRKGQAKTVSIRTLEGFYKRQFPANRENLTVDQRFAQLEPRCRLLLKKMQEHLEIHGLDLNTYFTRIDKNNDGKLQKNEFIEAVKLMKIPNITVADIGQVFDLIDSNGDGSLSANEFALFVQGAKKSKQQKMAQIPVQIENELKQEINELYRDFDENGDGKVTDQEIFRTMMAMGTSITLKDAQNMIRQVKQQRGTQGDYLNQEEFVFMMLPRMKEDLLKQEENVEDLRAKFIEADVDQSGTLTIDELYSVLIKMGVDNINHDELRALMAEMDADQNGVLDIDEFINLMSLGDEVQFQNAHNNLTYMNIKKKRRLNPRDFVKQFKVMPKSFVPSFIQERWTKMKKNLPSSVFKPVIDPTTMLYKDYLPANPQQAVNYKKVPRHGTDGASKIRMFPTELGGQILLTRAQGVPLPEKAANFDRNQIVKRAIRVALYDSELQQFVGNSCQVNVLYNAQESEDEWKFPGWDQNGMNPLIFRSTNKEDMLRDTVKIIFELVIYVSFPSQNKLTEMSCGFAQLSPKEMEFAHTVKLVIHGGNPYQQLDIDKKDIHNQRSGIRGTISKLGGSTGSELTVEIRNFQKMKEETRYHMENLPQLCLLNKRLLYFIVGFRNYVGQKLLADAANGVYRKPGGDMIISTFPMIIDNPDICEAVISTWSEEVWKNLNGVQKLDMKVITNKSEDFIKRIYPLLYADEFRFNPADPTYSACADNMLMQKRNQLLDSALKYGQTTAARGKAAHERPLEALTNFRPFTVRELEFDVWDCQESNSQQIRNFQELGMMKGDAGFMGHINPSPQMNQLGMGGIGNQNFNPNQPGAQNFMAGQGGLCLAPQQNPAMGAPNNFGGQAANPLLAQPAMNNLSQF